MWSDLMGPRAIADRGWFRPDAVARLRNLSQSRRADYYMLQWGLLTLELWARQFLDQNPATVAPQTRRRPTEIPQLVPAA